jgi:regulator of replication initiation timing
MDSFLLIKLDVFASQLENMRTEVLRLRDSAREGVKEMERLRLELEEAQEVLDFDPPELEYADEERAILEDELREIEEENHFLGTENAALREGIIRLEEKAREQEAALNSYRTQDPFFGA